MTNPNLLMALARARVAEVERRAAERGPLLAAIDEHARLSAHGPVTVRIALAADTAQLRQLLGDHPARELPAAPLLVGEIAGEPVAALSLDDGTVIATRRPASADVVALLRLRATQLGGSPQRRRRGLRRLHAAFR